MKLETEDFSYDLLQETSFIGDTTCTSCLAEFLDIEDLHVHVKQMHGPVTSPKYCQLCTATYTDLLDYAAHVRDAHLMDLRSCRYCTKVFLDGGMLKLHEKKHIGNDYTLYLCSQCDSMFNATVLLELHECKTHDNGYDGLVLKCMPCLSSVLNLKVVSLLQSVGKKILICATCNFTSTSLELYIQHLNEKECEGFACDRCSGIYKTKKSIIKHLKFAKKCISVDEYADETIECRDCHKVIHPKALQVHLKNCKALKCIDCNLICATIDELSRHQTIEHPLGMNLIQCKFCCKEFIGMAPLKKHINKVHRPYFDLYKYKCRDCNAIFQHPQKLFAHFFTKHKELMPFNCKICNKTFRVRKSFSLHIKLDHKSVGFVEFNDQYHVFFTANRSEKPFVPSCVLTEEDMYESQSEDVVESKTKGDTIQSPDLHQSDTDATNAESENDCVEPKKRKLTPKQIIKTKRSRKIIKKEPVLIYSSDEEPLLVTRKHTVKNKKVDLRRQWRWKKNALKKRTQFTCVVCNKNCYTYQNHQNHMSTHNKNLEIECVKCSKKFNTTNDLTKHINQDHVTSKLTETLKNLLQKKKQDDWTPSDDPTLNAPKKSDRFTIHMNKVKIDKSETPATITAVDTDLSVKNFIENFTPDVNDTSRIKISSTVSITRYYSPFYRKPSIKLTKFKDIPTYERVSLKMPQRFKQYDQFVKTKINIKLVERPIEPPKDFCLPLSEHNYSDNFQDYDDRDNDIPEVAQEVSLEGTEEPPKETIPRDHIQTKIIIPKMPKGYSKIHIATLQAEAPFFKIIKVDSNKLTEIKTEQEVVPKNSVISLPGGTKLVTANPLAHLLGDTPVDKILDTGKKQYKPVIKDFQGMLAQAMRKLEEAPPTKKRKPKASKKQLNQDTIPDSI